MDKIKIKNLENDNGRQVPNQFEIYTKDGIYFQSYQTLIAFKNYSTKKIYVGLKWDYSKTTLKYFKKFLGLEHLKKKAIQKMIDKNRLILTDLNNEV